MAGRAGGRMDRAAAISTTMADQHHHGAEAATVWPIRTVCGQSADGVGATAVHRIASVALG
jgi:hypothetical protein